MTTDQDTAASNIPSHDHTIGEGGGEHSHGGPTGIAAAANDGGTETGSQRLPVDVPAGSRLALLKAERDERLKKEELRLPIPTWEGKLVGVFRPMSIEERRDFGQRISAGSFDEVTVGAEFIAACCERLLVRNEAGKLEPELVNGRPAKLDPAFAHHLGFNNVTTAAGCFQQLVNWNVAAVEGVFEKLHEWSKDTSMAVEGALLGE